MEYPAEVRLEVYEAAIDYAASGTLSELKPLAKMAFSFIKKEIDYYAGRYDDVKTKRSEAGKKGMGNRYNKQQQTITKLTNDNKTNKHYQTITNVTDNDVDNVNDNISSSVDDDEKKEASSTSSSKIESEIQEMKNDAIWKEPICMKFRIGKSDLDRLLDEFSIDCRCSGKLYHDNRNDARRHFCSWLTKKNANEANRQTSHVQRRGTDADSDQPKDYNAPF